MTDEATVPRTDQKTEKWFLFLHGKEFDAYLANLIEEDRDVLIALGKS